MSKQVAWSYSRLSSFETCPRKFWHESVGKTIPFTKNAAATYGDEVHKAFANYFKQGQKLPLHLMHWTPVLSQIAAAPGEKVIEQQIALNASYEPVEWYAKDAWLRVISDLTQINGKQAVTWDWKTGKESQDFTQLKINAAVTFHLDPNIEEITMAYLWLKTKRPTIEKITVDQAPDVWAEVLPRVAKYQQAHDEQNFPPRPCFLCKGWCEVKTCQYWEPKR
jgi:CRISPR/Cas system-associated exonuclease Cas4 (RecB family)